MGYRRPISIEKEMPKVGVGDTIHIQFLYLKKGAYVKNNLYVGISSESPFNYHNSKKIKIKALKFSNLEESELSKQVTQKILEELVKKNNGKVINL